MKSFIAHCQYLCELQTVYEYSEHCLVSVVHPIAFFATRIIRTTAHNTDTLVYSHPTVCICI